VTAATAIAEAATPEATEAATPLPQATPGDIFVLASPVADATPEPASTVIIGPIPPAATPVAEASPEASPMASPIASPDATPDSSPQATQGSASTGSSAMIVNPLASLILDDLTVPSGPIFP
jgi:hypothetical protein